MSKSDEVLFVINGLEPVDLAALKFTVITDAADDRYGPFERGEIIVNDGDGGRELFGDGRRPAKVDVHEEPFGTLAEALACRSKVLAGEWPRRYTHAFVPRDDSASCTSCPHGLEHDIHFSKETGRP